MPRVISAVFAETRRSDHNLAPNHFRILRIVSRRPSSPSVLARALGVSLPSMSASVQTLVGRGWLERQRSSEDRRVTQLQVTRRGQQVLQEEQERVVNWTAALLEDLSPEELHKVAEGLAAFQHLFDENTPVQPMGRKRKPLGQASR